MPPITAARQTVPIPYNAANAGGLVLWPAELLSQPTEVEMQILRILWELGPSPVREIHKRLEADKGTNYSTTVKMLSVALQKGLVRRDEDAQPHVYRAALTRAKAGRRLLDDLVDKVYEGSAMSLVLEALSSTKATKKNSRNPPHARSNGGEIAMLERLMQSIWISRIGWTLIHTLWQFALVALAAFVVQRSLRRQSAAMQYWALLAAMAVMVAAPLATCFLRVVGGTAGDGGESHAALPILKKQLHRNPPMSILRRWRRPPQCRGKSRQDRDRCPVASEPKPVTFSAWWSNAQTRVRPWLPEIVLIWLIGVFLAAMRPVFGWHTMCRLKRTGVSSIGTAVQGMLERIAVRLKLDRTVEVLQSTLVHTPVVLGYFRPVDFAAGLDPLGPSGGAIGIDPRPRVGPYPPARLSGEFAPNIGRDAVLLPSGRVVALTADPQTSGRTAATTWQ